MVDPNIDEDQSTDPTARTVKVVAVQTPTPQRELRETGDLKELIEEAFQRQRDRIVRSVDHAVAAWIDRIPDIVHSVLHGCLMQAIGVKVGTFDRLELDSSSLIYKTVQAKLNDVIDGLVSTQLTALTGDKDWMNHVSNTIAIEIKSIADRVMRDKVRTQVQQTVEKETLTYVGKLLSGDKLGILNFSTTMYDPDGFKSEVGAKVVETVTKDIIKARGDEARRAKDVVQ